MDKYLWNVCMLGFENLRTKSSALRNPAPHEKQPGFWRVYETNGGNHSIICCIALVCNKEFTEVGRGSAAGTSRDSILEYWLQGCLVLDLTMDLAVPDVWDSLH